MNKYGTLFIFLLCCLLLTIFLPADFTTAYAFPQTDNIRNMSIRVFVKNDPVDHIKMESLWDRLFNRKTATPTPVPMPTATPEPKIKFWHHNVLITGSQETELSYSWTANLANVHFTVTPTGIIDVIKKNNRSVLGITGLQNGKADILMKDSAGKIIDSCHITVKMDSPNLFMDHNLSVIIGRKISLNYRWRDSLGDIQFSVRSAGVISVIKKGDSRTLEITGSKIGDAEILMKDSSGKILDTCRISVKPVPTATPLPVYSYFFSTHDLAVNKGGKITLDNYWYGNMNDIRFTVRPAGVARVEKKRNSLTLVITGTDFGKAEILMKDSAGNILDTCNVTVKNIPTSTPAPTKTPTPTPVRVTWKCHDNTVFDYNWYNDNICISSLNEVRYVNDDQAVALDPSYIPSKVGDHY